MIAFELREEYAGTVEQFETQADKDAGRGVEVPAFTGGIINAGARDVDVRELLDVEPHPGVIVIGEDDPALVMALDEYPPLKRTTVPAGAEVPTVGKYDGRLRGDLAEEARTRGVEGTARASRGALVAALTYLDELEAGANRTEADRLRLSEARAAGVDELAARADVAPTDDQAGDAGETTAPEEGSA